MAKILSSWRRLDLISFVIFINIVARSVDSVFYIHVTLNARLSMHTCTPARMRMGYLRNAFVNEKALEGKDQKTVT